MGSRPVRLTNEPKITARGGMRLVESATPNQSGFQCSEDQWPVHLRLEVGRCRDDRPGSIGGARSAYRLRSTRSLPQVYWRLISHVLLQTCDEPHVEPVEKVRSDP
jgi:hypothetical protein